MFPFGRPMMPGMMPGPMMPGPMMPGPMMPGPMMMSGPMMPGPMMPGPMMMSGPMMPGPMMPNPMMMQGQMMMPPMAPRNNPFGSTQQPRVIDRAFTGSSFQPLDPNGSNFRIKVRNVDTETSSIVIMDGRNDFKYHEQEVRQGTTAEIQLSHLMGKSLKIERWRPGAFGVRGNGGGIVLFDVPSGGSSILDLQLCC